MANKDNKNRSKTIKIIILCLLVVLAGSFAVFFYTSGDKADRLTVTDLDVGKADCAILQYKDTAGIIDTATEEEYETIVSFMQRNNIKSFDYMILTHFDKDHIGSAVKILDKYEVRQIFIPDYVSEKKHYPELMEKLEGMDGVVIVSAEEESFEMYDMEISVIPAEDPGALTENEKNYDNNMSLLTMVTLGSNRLFFTGDIEKERISQIIESGAEINADWIKMPHHGSYEKRINKFLKMVSPLYSVISTSSDNPPDEKLIEVIERNNIENFDTINGNIVTICDGKDITVIKE